MNKNNARDYLPLVQALADGKTIQKKWYEVWYDIKDDAEFDLKPEYYRIKPEPRTFEIWVHKIGGDIHRKAPPNWMNENNSWERITVQEVLK
jgi:hypothetical protein